MLNISNRFREIDDIKKELPKAYTGLKEHFLEVGLSPVQIIAEYKGVCFADLVAWGGTFERLFEFLHKWAVEDRCDLPALVGKISFVGITRRVKTSPNTWRWQQNAEWVLENNKLAIKNVSVPNELWDYLGNRQPKVAKTNSPEHWGCEELMLPPREEGNLKALKQAFQIYGLGLEQKYLFAERLASMQEVREPWLRGLMNELKKTAKGGA